MARINAVLFDLDNVLYDEKDYFMFAFQKISCYLSERCGISQSVIYKKLETDFKNKTSMYPCLFNDLIAYCGLDQELTVDVLKIFSSIEPNLVLFSDSEPLLLKLKGLNVKLGLITNGNVETQKNKVNLLQIAKFFDFILYASKLGINKEKPHPESYQLMLQSLGVKAEETLCIGDNPFTDFLGAKQLGIRTVRLRSGEFKDINLSQEYEAEFNVNKLFEVYPLIANM